MDINKIDREKRIVQCLLATIPIKIKSLNSDECYRYLVNHPDTDIRNLIKVVHVAANHVECSYHRDLIKTMMNIGLAACCRNEKYTKVLSDVMSAVYDHEVNIKPYKKFNVIEQVMIKILLKVLHKTMKQSTYRLNEVHGLMDDCTNDAVSFIYKVSNYSMKDTLTEKECSLLVPFFDVGFYTLYQDTAYRDIFFWVLNKMANPELKAVIKPFVNPPKKWYVNIWYTSKHITGQLRRSGSIPQYEHSVVERRMIPAKQMSDLSKKLGK